MRYYTFSALLILLILAAATASPGHTNASTPGGVGQTIYVPWTSTPPQIDGYTDDWPEFTPTVLDATNASFREGGPPYPSSADASMLIWPMWSATHLFLRIQASDDILINDSDAEVWKDDEIELGFDGTHNFTGPDEGDHHFTFNPDGRITDFTALTTAIQAVIRATNDGWLVEAAIPLAQFRSKPFASGDEIGFNFGLRDDDNGGTWDIKLVWQSDAINDHWNQFGKLRLVNGPILVSTSLRQGVNGYQGNEDTWIDSFAPNVNRGSDGVFAVRTKGQASALIRYELAHLPPDVDIQRAVLRLDISGLTNANPIDIAAYGMRRQWDANSATWLQAASGRSWGSPGASSPVFDRFEPATAVTHIAEVGKTYEWDITPLVQLWYTEPSANFGLQLAGLEGGSVLYSFFSAQAATQAIAKRPQLLIEYLQRPAAATSTPTVTATPMPASPTPTTTATPTPPLVTATVTDTPTVTSTATPSFTQTPTSTLTSTATPTPSVTPTATPIALSIEQALPVACDSSVQGNNAGWPSNVGRYTSCRGNWAETGPEALYLLTVFDPIDLMASILYDPGQADLDLFLLNGPSPSDCLVGADAAFTAVNLPAGDYYLAIDGYQGGVAPFQLNLVCTPRLDFGHYLPLLLR